MNFGAPHWFLSFLILLPLGLLYAWASKKRMKDIQKFADLNLFDSLADSFAPQKQQLKMLFLTAALLLGLFALCRPQWSFRLEKVRTKGLDITIALDISKSMLSEDVKPNRLERSKLAIKDLVKRLRGDRIGLIAFAGDAFLQCPLTTDYSAFMEVLESVNTNTPQRGGTAIARAIDEAMRSYAGATGQNKILVLITDGEDHEGRSIEEAETARKNGIIIHSIGIGTREGELIPLADDEGASGYLKDKEGHVVKSRLDEELLQKIALTTQGTYIKSTVPEFGLDWLYQQKLSKMEKRELQTTEIRIYTERFQIFLSFMIIFLCAELLLTETKRGYEKI